MSVLHIVVMGVTGCGKSTVGARLAKAVGAEFLDGDSLHPAANIAKMAAGTPLGDDDRKPWLKEIGSRFASSEDQSLVVACSALKRLYRDIIRAGAPDVRFVHLHGAEKLLVARVAARPGHFMPAALLQSQLATLEPLQPDETGVVLDIARPPQDLSAEAARWALLARRRSSTPTPK